MRPRLHAARAIAVAAIAVAIPAPAADGRVVLEDAAGRKVTLARPPQRLLVIGDGTFMLAHLLYMFPEGRGRMVGMERKGRSEGDFLRLLDPSFATKVQLSTNPGPEQIAGTHPDLVLTRGTRADEKARALAAIGIKTAYLGLESPAQYLEDLGRLGTILANPGRAGAVASYYRDRLAAVRTALEGVPATGRPRVLLAMAIARGGKVAVQVPARSWMQTQIVEAAGGSPVWLDSAEKVSGWRVVNMEQIALWDPDKVFIVFWHAKDTRQAVAELRADPHWAALRAVRSGELRAFPGDHYGWDSPDPRWILGLLWAAAMTHPDRFPRFDIDAEIDRFFNDLYQMDRAAVAQGIRPAITMPLH